MIRRFFQICFVLGISFACSSQGSTDDNATTDTDITSLKKEVIIQHDTAMARMNHIANLQKKLQQEMTMEDSAAFAMTYTELQAARDAMMNWMREFDVPADSSDEGQMRYLKGEYDRIKEVDENMLLAINKAEKLLEDKALD